MPGNNNEIRIKLLPFKLPSYYCGILLTIPYVQVTTETKFSSSKKKQVRSYNGPVVLTLKLSRKTKQ